MPLKLSATIDSRFTFTGQFLEASSIFVRRLRAIETSASPEVDEETRREHMGLVCTVIMQCAAALETEAHEICMHGPGSYLGTGGTDKHARDFLSPVGEIIDRLRPLYRFDMILHLLEKPSLEKGSHPYQSAALVVRLRNELVHYKSRWGVDMESNKLHAALQLLQHKPPPFIDRNSSFFPHLCLSADCAAWALKSTVAFLENVYESLGVPSRFESYRSRLDPDIATPLIDTSNPSKMRQSWRLRCWQRLQNHWNR